MLINTGVFRDFPRPDLGQNKGPFPIKNEENLPIWCISFPLSYFYILVKI